MQPNTPCTLNRRVTTALVACCLLQSPLSANESSTPAPKPGTLGAYAQHVQLNRSALQNDGGIVLTNNEVAAVAREVTITLGTVVAPEPTESASSNGSESGERERWTAAHRKQSQVIAKLKQRRSLLAIDVDVLDDQRPTPKLLARLDRARAKLRHVYRQIDQEKEILARIVRQARQHGAQPDWFR